MTGIGKCVVCKNEVVKRQDIQRFRLKPVLPELDSVEHNVPFYCSICGSIKSPLTALHDFVFVYPLYKSSVLGEGILVRPETYKPEISDYGIIISFGPGYYNSKRFVPVNDLRIGMKVIYDKTVPWEVEWLGTDKKQYVIKCMNFLDVKLVPVLGE